MLPQHFYYDEDQPNTAMCDQFAPPISLPPGQFAQYDQFRALHVKEAFWSLPFVDRPRFGSIWSLIVQHFLGLTGSRLMLHIPSSQLVMADTQDHSSSTEATKVILKDSKCNSTSLNLCIFNLVTLLSERRIVDLSVVQVLKQWLQSLAQIGYKFPAVGTKQTVMCFSDKIIFQPVDHNEEQTESSEEIIPILNSYEINKVHKETCQTYQNTSFFEKVTLSQPWAQFSNILLLVVFNNPYYESIPFVETLYRPFFPHILYCGPGLPNLSVPPGYPLNNFQFSFYPYRPTIHGNPNGSFNYECIINAFRMKYPVDGILFLADDVLLAPGKVKGLQYDSIWYVPVWDTINDDIRDPIIAQWRFKKYRKQVAHLLNRMQREETNVPLIHQCFNHLVSRNGDKYRVNGGFADIYYIPQRISQKFTFLGSVFLQEWIFLEIAIPTLIQCLDGLNNVEILNGEYRNQQAVAPWLKLMNPKFKSRSYLHRTKWGFLARNNPRIKSFQDLFCNKALPWVHDVNGTLPV